MSLHHLKTCLAIAAATILPNAATAQDTTQPTGGAGTALLRVAPTRIEVSLSMQLPIAGAGIEEQTRQGETIRKLVYESAQRECAILKDLFKAECRLRSMRVSASMQTRNREHDALTVSGQASYELIEQTR